jgi:thiol:disulfide interchange protein DsbA
MVDLCSTGWQASVGFIMKEVIMDKYIRKSFLLTVLFVFAMVSYQASAEQWVEGVNYKVLKYPVKTSDPKKIEVVEEFWYGCPHCYHLLPLITPWAKQLPKDVDFKLLPAAFSKIWKLHAQTFYTAKALGVEEKLHQKIFDALARDHQRLFDEDSMADFFAKQGVNKENFKNAFNSFGVKVKLDEAIKRAKQYRITGVPTLIVNGKYTITASEAGSQENMLKVADYLIEKERKAMVGK